MFHFGGEQIIKLLYACLYLTKNTASCSQQLCLTHHLSPNKVQHPTQANQSICTYHVELNGSNIGYQIKLNYLYELVLYHLYILFLLHLFWS